MSNRTRSRGLFSVTSGGDNGGVDDDRVKVLIQEAMQPFHESNDKRLVAIETAYNRLLGAFIFGGFVVGLPSVVLSVMQIVTKLKSN